MSYKDFDAMLREKLGGRPDFFVGGQKFTARAKLPWKKFSYLMLSLGETGTSEDEIQRTEKFFKLVLIPADRERFAKLIDSEGEDSDDDDDVIDPQQIKAILDWLLEYYTGGKPEESADPSSESPLTTGQPVKTISASLNPVN